MDQSRDPETSAKIVAFDADAKEWLALADEATGCVDPRAAPELREAVRVHGVTSPGALQALCRIILGLECDARVREAAAARRAFDAWFSRAEHEQGDGFGQYARTLAAMLTSHGLHKDAVTVLERAQSRAGADAWLTASDLGESLCSLGETERSVQVLRALNASPLPLPALFEVRATLASVLARVGLYDEAVAIYRDLAAREPSSSLAHKRTIQAAVAARCSGDELTARQLLFELLARLKAERAVCSFAGVTCVDQLLGLLLLAEDERAIDVQRALVDAVAETHGPEHPAALQERKNLAVVLLGVGHQDEAKALTSELATLLRVPDLLPDSLDRSRPHVLPA
jgi:tetratricopeptide (TPR) repeat protein